MSDENEKEVVEPAKRGILAKVRGLLPALAFGLLFIAIVGNLIVNAIDPSLAGTGDEAASEPAIHSKAQRTAFLAQLDTDESGYIEALEMQGEANNGWQYDMPEGTSFSCNVEKTTRAGMQTYVINENTDGKTILYLHGGGYVIQPVVSQWNFADTVALRTGARVFVPIYPVAPNFDCSISLPRVVQLYKELVGQYGAENVIVMGDSAGGGMAMALVEYFWENDIEEPALVIAISPWLDVSLSNPETPAFDKLDSMLSAEELRVWGRAWAGELDIWNYQVSPLFFDFETIYPDDYPRTLLFVGTNDLMYPDVMELQAVAEELGFDTSVEVGAGSGHDYPLFTSDGVSGRDALNQICLAISNQ